MNIEVIGAMFANHGHQIDFALNGKRALELIDDRLELVYAHVGTMYRLILLDYSMPEMDGPQVAQALRSKFKEETLLSEEQIPFIACCTAYNEASYKRWAL